MSFTFEWDDEKASENITKHGVSFSEASTVFADPLSRTIIDPLHSEAEERFIVVGESGLQHTLVDKNHQREKSNIKRKKRL